MCLTCGCGDGEASLLRIGDKRAGGTGQNR